MNTTEQYEQLPEPLARHVDRICDQFESELRNGRSPDPRAYLESCPEAAHSILHAELRQLVEHYRSPHDITVTLGGKADTSTGTVVQGDPRYVWLREIGIGGMGRVSLCIDQQMGRPVAVKELRPELLGNTEAAARFRQEARITGRLSHPSIVPVYELANPVEGGHIFYTMRHVEGETMTNAVQTYHRNKAAGSDTQFELVRLLNAFVAVCQTVAYAHSQGVLHRDLKGSNVVLGSFGEVIVLDWGLAKIVDDQRESTDSGLGDTASTTDRHTRLGTVTGTPGYMAPEQARGRVDRLGPHTDIYGLGAILYEILTGQPPFVGPTASAIIALAAAGNPVSPSDRVPDVPGELASACQRALAKDPEDRHPSAAIFAEAIQHWLADTAERSRARQERERFFGLSLDLLCTVGADGRFQQLNPAWPKSLGWSVERLESTSLFDLLHPDDHDLTRTALATVAAGAELPPFVNRCRHATGDWRWVSWSMTLIKAENLLYGVGRDVTAQKEAEAALQRSQERFELAVRGSGVGLWDWDRETGESYYSPRWKSMIGYEDHEIPHNLDEWEARVHPDDLERALSALRSCINGNATEYEVEYRFRHKNGTYLWIRDRGVAVSDATGNVIRMAGSHTAMNDRAPEPPIPDSKKERRS